MDFMRALPDKAYDLAIVDPPYGLGKRTTDGGGTNSQIKFMDDIRRNTIEELSRKYELHPNQINIWKREFLNNATAAFGVDKEVGKKEAEADLEKLYAQIGQMKVENDWLKKKLQ